MSSCFLLLLLFFVGRKIDNLPSFYINVSSNFTSYLMEQVIEIKKPNPMYWMKYLLGKVQWILIDVLLGNILDSVGNDLLT